MISTQTAYRAWHEGREGNREGSRSEARRDRDPGARRVCRKLRPVPRPNTGYHSIEATRDRAIGALIGLAVGDAVGTTLEFKRRDSYEPLRDMIGGGPFRLKAGEWTDDTSMALCLADSLIATDGQFDAADLMGRFVRWRDEGENSVNDRGCFDIGITTSSALNRWLDDKNPYAGSVDAAVCGKRLPHASSAGADPFLE